MAEAAQTIREAVLQVQRLRAQQAASPGHGQCVLSVKQFQSCRFAGTYADFLRPGPTQDAARFFMEELYGARDFSARDQQFGRIAGALERVFPQTVVQTAVKLAALHALSERLDDAMAHAWALQSEQQSIAGRYLQCWQTCVPRADRERQVKEVLELGHDLVRLTRITGLRTLLRMMRGPAQAAGLSDLQGFLETGFDRFSALSKNPGGAEHFMRAIETREAALIDRLYDGDPVASEAELHRLTGGER